MGDVSNTSTVNTETDKCKLWAFGAHIGFVLRPMKWSESHRDESIRHKLEESKATFCPKCFCQAEPSVRSMNTT